MATSSENGGETDKELALELGIELARLLKPYSREIFYQVGARLKEISGEDGKIQPSKAALDFIEREHSDLTAVDKRRAATMKTLHDFVKKCLLELN